MSHPLLNLYKLVEPEMNQVSKVIETTLLNTQTKPLREINSYILSAKGKRLRPLLCLLFFKVHNGKSENLNQVIHLAAALELIHMASLIHDDIIDKADIRHNQPSVYAKWGTEAAIPIGVYLYSMSLSLIAKTNNIALLQRISKTVQHLCEGELVQVLERDNLNLDIKSHLLALKKKTAVLFSLACFSGTYLAGQSLRTCYKAKHFGFGLGMGFQISDDVMDFTATEKQLGKKPGQDYEQGEMTLPILLLLKNASPELQKTLITSMQSKEATFDQIKDLLVQHPHAIENTKSLALGYLNVAKKSLEGLPQNSYKDSFEAILTLLQNRM